MITISEPLVSELNNDYNVSVTVTDTENDIVLGTRSISVTVRKSDDPKKIIDPLVMKAVEELKLCRADIVRFSAPLANYKSVTEAIIAKPIGVK